MYRFLVLFCVMGIVAFASFFLPSAKANTTTFTHSYSAYLQSVNNAKAMGFAKFYLQDNMLLVKLRIYGIEPNRIHPQHIHGFANNQDARCAPPSADQNQNGLLETPEAEVYSGQAMLDLTPFPYVGTPNLAFQGLYKVDANTLLPLENRVIEIHGLSVAGVYDEMLPIACGEIRPSLF